MKRFYYLAQGVHRRAEQKTTSILNSTKKTVNQYPNMQEVVATTNGNQKENKLFWLSANSMK